MTKQQQVADFIANNPGATALVISEKLGLDEKRIAKLIGNYNRLGEGKIVPTGKIGRFNTYEFSGEKTVVVEKTKSPEIVVTPSITPRQRAANALSDYVGEQLRADFDAALASILPRIVDSALSGITSDIRSAIAAAFEPAPVADEIAIPKPPASVSAAPQEKSNAPMVEVPAPVVNVLSTRTKHREKSKPVAAAQHEVIRCDRKQKAVVVGLHSNKQEFIRREFRECFDLRLYTPDQLRATQDGTHAGDLAFLMADFVSHKHQDALEAAGAQIVVVHGGISALREAMTKAFVGEDKAA